MPRRPSVSVISAAGKKNNNLQRTWTRIIWWAMVKNIIRGKNSQPETSRVGLHRRVRTSVLCVSSGPRTTETTTDLWRKLIRMRSTRECQFSARKFMTSISTSSIWPHGALLPHIARLNLTELQWLFPSRSSNGGRLEINILMWKNHKQISTLDLVLSDLSTRVTGGFDWKTKIKWQTYYII